MYHDEEDIEKGSALAPALEAATDEVAATMTATTLCPWWDEGCLPDLNLEYSFDNLGEQSGLEMSESQMEARLDALAASNERLVAMCAALQRRLDATVYPSAADGAATSDPEAETKLAAQFQKAQISTMRAEMAERLQQHKRTAAAFHADVRRMLHEAPATAAATTAVAPLMRNDAEAHFLLSLESKMDELFPELQLEMATSVEAAIRPEHSSL